MIVSITIPSSSFLGDESHPDEVSNRREHIELSEDESAAVAYHSPFVIN